jgi:hypothetical protein
LIRRKSACWDFLREHLAAALSKHFDKRLYDAVDTADRADCRSDFAVIVYPGYLALAEQGFANNPDITVT